MPARILPIYRHIYARAMNYSADKVAAVLVGQKEAIDSIIILSHDPYFITTVDKERYLKDIESFGTKWHYYARSNYHRNSDVPILVYRIAALSDSNGD